jgi:hypothetical protein
VQEVYWKKKMLNTGRTHVLQTDELKHIGTGKQVSNYSTGPEAEPKNRKDDRKDCTMYIRA